MPNFDRESWLDRLAEVVVDRLRAALPELRLEIMDVDTVAVFHPAGGQFGLSLEQLRKLLRDADDPESYLDHVVRGWASGFQPKPDGLALDTLAPMLKPSGWPKQWQDPNDPPVRLALNAALDVLVMDLFGEQLRFACRRHLDDLGVSAAQLVAMAVTRFGGEAVPAVEWIPIPDRPLLHAKLLDQPHFNAGLALLPQVWDLAREKLREVDLRVALPDRETCLFVGGTYDAAWLQRFEQHMASNSERAYPLSPRLFRQDELPPLWLH